MIKEKNIHTLVRENIRDLKPYRSARDDFDSGILLDANENSFGSPHKKKLALHRYPMPYQVGLRKLIAEFRGITHDQVFVGVGSDEAIDLLFRIFCRPGKDRILINPPTYGMYKVSANINDVGIDEVLLGEDFQLQTDKILESVKPETKMIFICSPNNPTSNSMRKLDLLEIIENFDGIVVIDEAYIDFSLNNSMAEKVRSYPNLVILQTMSKSFGLAGIRVGIAMANAEIIHYMMKVKAPYNVNKLSSMAAVEAFSNLDAISRNIHAILNERDNVTDRLQEYEEVEKVYPSDANFVLFKVKEARKIYEELAKEGVVIRYRGNEPLCENGLRLTVGTPDENKKFFKAFEKVLKHL